MRSILYLRTVLSILLVYTFLFTGCSGQKINEKQINVVFRFDDPSALSSTEIELKVIKAFREHNASVTFGVIPYKCANTRDTSPQELFALDKKKGALLKQVADEGVVDIALHGYSHQMRKSKIWTEFSGMDYDSQYDKLSKGKKLLEDLMGKPISTFIPPYNSYDLNTLKALEKLGFTILSAGIYEEVPKVSTLKFMPEMIRLHQLRDAVKQARISSDKQPVIIVMFHQYDFMDVKIKGIDKRIITFSEFNDLLDWLTSQKDVRILSLTQASKVIDDLSSKRFRFVKLYHFLEPVIPHFLRKNNSVYPELSPVLGTLAKTLLLYLFIMLMAIFLAYMMGCSIARKSTNLMKFTTVGNTVITVALFIYILSDMEVHLKGMIIMTVLVGITMGLWICFYKAWRRSIIL